MLLMVHLDFCLIPEQHWAVCRRDDCCTTTTSPPQCNWLRTTWAPAAFPCSTQPACTTRPRKRPTAWRWPPVAMSPTRPTRAATTPSTRAHRRRKTPRRKTSPAAVSPPSALPVPPWKMTMMVGIFIIIQINKINFDRRYKISV